MTDEVVTEISNLKDADLSNNKPYKIIGANGQTYSAFTEKPEELEKGLIVRIEYKKNDKGYKNIKNVKVLDDEEEKQEARDRADSKEENMKMMNALNNATNTAENMTSKEVIETADEYMEWLNS